MRYYFHLRDSSGVRKDIEGVELASPHAAATEAWESAREMIAERIRVGRRINVDTTFEVSSEEGAILHKVSFADVLTSCL